MVLLISFSFASFKNPGHLKSEIPFWDLLQNVSPTELCPECRVIRTVRSKHCVICNRCVERFDHHCPWINACVGEGNHNSFLVFLVTLLLVLLTILASTMTSLIDDCYSNTDQVCVLQQLCYGCNIMWLRYTVAVITLLVGVFFGVPVCVLSFVHIRNYSAGQTTNERFAANKDQRFRSQSQASASIYSEDNQSEDFSRRRQKSCFQNWGDMCCTKNEDDQRYLYDLHIENDSAMSSQTSNAGHSFLANSELKSSLV